MTHVRVLSVSKKTLQQLMVALMLALLVGLPMVQLTWADDEQARADVELTARRYAAAMERFRAAERDSQLKAVQRYATTWEHFRAIEKEAQMETAATGRYAEARDRRLALLDAELSAQRYATTWARFRAAERDSQLRVAQRYATTWEHFRAIEKEAQMETAATGRY